MRLFNKNFFRFVYGFMGMLAIGLFGIIIIGYLTPDENSPETTVTAESVETES